MRKVRQLYAMLDGHRAAAPRPCAAISARTGVDRLRAVRPLPQPAGERPTPRRPRRRRSRPCTAWAAGSAAGASSTTCSARPRTSATSEAALSTYGIGQEFSAAGWRDLLDQLLFEGLLREDPNDGRPLIGLGEADAVRAVYRGERRVSVRQMPASAEASRPCGPHARQAPQRRAAGHRAPRTRPCSMRCVPGAAERAAEQHVPPYVIFHDATLSAIARQRPASLDALAKISGVGKSKLKRYGADVLQVVREI